MALDKEKLYKTIYTDLARKKNLVAGVEINGDSILTADWTDLTSNDVLHQRGMINSEVVDTADGDGTRLTIDLIASTVADRVVNHILGYPETPNPDVLPAGTGGGLDEGGNVHEGLRTTGAETQIIALKDHVKELGAKVKSMGDEINALNNQNQSLVTEMITLFTNAALTNSNIVTMLTAENTLHQVLAAEVPGSYAAAIATYQATMQSVVTSWTTIASQHTAFATATALTLNGQYTALQGQVTAVQAEIDALLATADSTFIAGTAVTVE